MNHLNYGAGRRHLAAAICALVLLVGLFAFPMVSKQSGAAEEDSELIVGVLQKPDTLNPFKMALSISYTINFLVYDTLTSVEPDLSPGDQLAESWTTDASGLVWTFNLVENAKWHDGQDVTADDVVFTYNTILENPDTCALWIDYLSNIVHPVVAIDDYTVQITTDVKKATMLTIMVPILPEHLWSEVDVDKLDKIDPWDQTAFPDGPIGSGPLILDEYDATLGWIRMLAWDEYYIDQVVVDQVLFKIFLSDTTMMEALWADDIDVAMGVPARLWTETLETDGIAGQAVKALSIFELGINCASPELRENFPKASDNLETTNLSVRQAIAMATDKDYIVNDVMEGLAEVGDSIIPTATSYWHYYVDEETRWDYQIAKANALLDAAGYVDTDGNDIRDNGTSGVDLEFSFYYRSDKTDDRSAAIDIEDSLAEIGIKATPAGISEGQMYNLWLGCQMDLFIWAWDTDVDPNFMLSTQTTDQIPQSPQDWTRWSDSFWSNATYDRMYLEQQTTVDKEERQSIILEMQALLYDQCPYVVLYYPMGLYAYTTERFTNYPDMTANAGMTPGSMWFFFEVTPVADWVDPMPPENVNAGQDQSCTVGETLSFTGEADDENDATETLTWEWEFTEPDLSSTVLDGRTVSYKFDQTGIVSVMLRVTDPGGLSGVDDLVVNVTDLAEGSGWLRGVVSDEDSVGIVGATILVSDQSRSTDVDGAYMVSLPEGSYMVNASKTGYGIASGDAIIVAGETTWVNLTLALTSGTLSGYVYDNETGASIASATVEITYGDKTKKFTTNATGFYSFIAVEAGTVIVNVTKIGYEKNVTTAEVTAGNTTVCNVNLTPVKDDSGGISAVAIAGIIAVIAIVGALAAIMMMKRRKSAEPPSPPEEPPLTS